MAKKGKAKPLKIGIKKSKEVKDLYYITLPPGYVWEIHYLWRSGLTVVLKKWEPSGHKVEEK